MRLRLAWAMAIRLPTTSEIAARPASSQRHSSDNGPTPVSSRRQAMPKAASFGAELMNSAIGAVAPW